MRSSNVFLVLVTVLSGGCHRGKKPPEAKDIQSLVAGDGHACALFKDGTLRCWGQNGDGQAGGNPGAPVLQPQALAAGKRDGLAILEGWRFEQFGHDALDLVEGRLGFGVKNGKLKMTRTEEA